MRAKCRGMEDALFPEASDQKRARLSVLGCPVRFECLAEALDNRIEWGVWGGMTERERRLLLRQRTDVASWSSMRWSGRQRRSVLVSAPTRRSDSRSVTSVGNDGTSVCATAGRVATEATQLTDSPFSITRIRPACRRRASISSG